MVMGPTPPGTGVIAPATSAAAGSTSPHEARALAVQHAVDADVDHRGAGRDPVGLDHGGPARRGDHDLGPAHHRGQVAGARVRDRHGAGVREQERRHRLADDVRAPDDHRLTPRQVAEMRAQEHQAAQGRAGHQRPASGAQEPDIRDVEAVHVLGGIDGAGHQRGLDVVGQRKLHQDAMHRRVGVEALDQAQKLLCVGLGREAVLEALHADLARALGLGADVDLARRILAHQHHGEARHDAEALQALDLCRHSRLERLGRRLAVDDRGRH